MGGECVPNNGRWEVGVTPLDLTYIGKKLFGVETLVRYYYHHWMLTHALVVTEYSADAQRPCPISSSRL